MTLPGYQMREGLKWECDKDIMRRGNFLDGGNGHVTMELLYYYDQVFSHTSQANKQPAFKIHHKR